MTITLLGRHLTRTVAVAARGRVSQELGEWGVSGDFGVEVACGASVCAASLVMWDQAMQRPNTSVPLTGCAAR